ncbi:hypothetical protein HYDPIDRAFT_115936 [Hydnomerulius pinastri MD-312]|uniref:Uncharacterized protein n=1 Tax=Hydnomerulius pinastri MD-312 TaxID=994086 RepID=A0A0C9VTW5_9AGAM|nr:hypothetical protein HYDPIDRAFT_115936 [Hydnomerulius pinastri MD-312]
MAVVLECLAALIIIKRMDDPQLGGASWLSPSVSLPYFWVLASAQQRERYIVLACAYGTARVSLTVRTPTGTSSSFATDVVHGTMIVLLGNTQYVPRFAGTLRSLLGLVIVLCATTLVKFFCIR